MFQGRYTGCTAKTGVEMPDFSKIAYAFGLKHVKISTHQEVKDTLELVYKTPGPIICEWLQDVDQAIEPRVMSRKLEDGTLVSPVIDDLFPFLDKETYEAVQFKNYENM